MSAYVVDDLTINKVISWLYMESDHSVTRGLCRRTLQKAGYDLVDSEDTERLANDLFSLNVRAVEEKYGEGSAREFRSLDFKYCFAMPQDATRTVKALHCLLYQCSEGNVPEDPLYQVLQKIQQQICRGIVVNSRAYELADWG